MNEDRVILASKTVELSETKTYIELTNRLCYYNEPNLNGVKLPSDGALEKAETLVNMPVVAKVRQNAQGLPDFGSHECYIDPVSGEVKFGTENIGTHISVEIKDDIVEVGGVTKTLPCLFAISRVWTRNKNAVAAIKRLFADGKLFSSWEIVSTAFTYDNGVKTLTDYAFEGNCLLGETVAPAYGKTSCALGLASRAESVLLVAEALALDLSNTDEEEPMNEEINMAAEQETDVVVQQEEQSAKTDVSAENEKHQDEVSFAEDTVVESETEDSDGETPAGVEVSMLTSGDIRRKLTEAYRAAHERWAWCSFLFPADNLAWFEEDDRETELDYVQVGYTVVGDDVVIGAVVPVKLSVSVAAVNQTIAEKDDALVKANEKINELSAQVSALKPYKDAADAAERERIEAERKEKREAFISQMKKTKLFGDEEIETSEILKPIIEQMDEAALKAEIAERFMKKLDTDGDGQDTPTSVETAEAVPAASAERIMLDSGETVDTQTVMKFILGR